MDEKKRGVASEQRTWEARQQEVSATRVLTSVSDASSLIIIERSSLGSWISVWTCVLLDSEEMKNKPVAPFCAARHVGA